MDTLSPSDTRPTHLAVYVMFGIQRGRRRRCAMCKRRRVVYAVTLTPPGHVITPWRCTTCSAL